LEITGALSSGQQLSIRRKAEMVIATKYVGFYGQTDSVAALVQAPIRDTGASPQAFREKVNGFPASLPDRLKLIGSWPGSGRGRPGVMVVEADDFAALNHINTYYNGWLAFEWAPSFTGGVPRNL
jgi:hypothetical protein